MNRNVRNTLILLIIAVLVSIVINILQFDLKFQSLFFQNNEWIYKNVQPWQFLYDYGNIPALFLAIGGFLLLLLSYYVKKYIPYRKIAIYLILVMVIGPGLITNSILKDQWGRPRPRNVSEFSGKYEFEPVLTIDASSKGKSFPCGHATMGFYLFVLYFLLRYRKKRLAAFFFGIGIVYGGIIGFARIVQGGHFFSDVIWAGVIVYLSSLWLFIACKLDKNLYLAQQTELAKNRFKITVGIILGMFALAALVFLATPYETQYDRSLSEEAPSIFVFQIENADVIIKSDSLLSLTISTFGHGFPGSKEKKSFRFNEAKDSLYFRQRIEGLFSELNSQIEIGLPESLIWRGEIELEKGTIAIQNLTNVRIISEVAPTVFSEKWLQEDNAYLRENAERKIILKSAVPLSLE